MGEPSSSCRLSRGSSLPFICAFSVLALYSCSQATTGATGKQAVADAAADVIGIAQHDAAAAPDIADVLDAIGLDVFDIAVPAADALADVLDGIADTDVALDESAVPDVLDKTQVEVWSLGDASLPADVSESTTGCKDLRKKGDNKVMWDDCWDPPLHYCAPSGNAAMTWLGCKPDAVLCCVFPSECIPCGWIHCGPSAPLSLAQKQQCAAVGKASETAPSPPDECLPYMPSNTATFCWDGFDPAWSQKENHKDDNASWLNFYW